MQASLMARMCGYEGCTTPAEFVIDNTDSLDEPGQPIAACIPHVGWELFGLLDSNPEPVVVRRAA
jgi:hypothetical protein